MTDNEARAHILALYGLRATLLEAIRRGSGKKRGHDLTQQLREVQWRIRQVTVPPESK